MIAPTTEKFPYSSFPIRLDLKEGKDNRVCWFECQLHVDKFIYKHKLKKKDYTLTVKDNV
jgi:hypothetical protein